ncbi:MAG: aspartyl/asparaginyl beta-hydroxylase domain-containing protein [Pseudobdellovibrio sp.]
MSAVEKLIEIKNADTVYKLLLKYVDCADFKKWKQLSLTSSDGNSLFDGVGSLYNYEKKEFIAPTEKFNILNNVFVSTEVESLYMFVKNFAMQNYQVNIGRVRLMRLEPKTCLTYHLDLEEFRFHVPLISNEKCFFVVNDLVYRMSDTSTLYKFKTNLLHTAVNASTEIRDHLVFDTY